MFLICRNVCYFIIFSHLSVSHLRKLNFNKTALRVMGGRNATRGEFPYVMRMGIQVSGINESDVFHFACTCSLIKPTWSLTASHCIQSVKKYLDAPNIKGVIRYDLLTAHGTSTSDILSLVSHPNYKQIDLSGVKTWHALHDIGLLKSEEIPVLSYAKISSVDYTTLLGHKMLALGYGRTTGTEGVYDIADKVNKSLQVLDVIAAQCYDSNVKITPGFCINGPCWEWSAVCHGDSGGPVVHPSGIVGVNTATKPVNCLWETAMAYKMNTFSGFITPISPYIEWITNTIKN